MNKKYFLLSVAATLICSISFAKIWRVNNNAGVTADFTTAQAAHNGAAAGDTIHLEPSVTSYGALTTTKKLTWISTGNFISVHPGLQYSGTPGTMDGVTVNAGSENSVFSCNAGYFYCSASNITFLRCFILNSYLYITGANNCAILNCYINAAIYVQGAKNTIINNNIIANYISVDATSSAVIVNNVMNTTSSGGVLISNSQIQNNIIDQESGSVYTFTNCTVNNNIANDASLPTGNGNNNSVDMTTVFVNSNGTTDADFVLKTGGTNPAIGTGYGGVNMGAYAGGSPFVSALQPAIPAIYQITAPAAPNGNTMNVTFSTKSNN